MTYGSPMYDRQPVETIKMIDESCASSFASPSDCVDLSSSFSRGHIAKSNNEAQLGGGMCN